MSLRGVRVLIGRPAGRGDALLQRLAECGAKPVHLPCIRIQPADLTDAVRREAERARASSGTWWVLTSPAAVAPLADALARHTGGSLPDGVSLAVVGPGTESAAQAYGFPVHFTPSHTTAFALGHELPVRSGARAVLWLGDLARTELERILAERGTEVERVTAYRTVADPDGAREAGRLLAGRAVDAVLLTSPSILDALIDHFPGSREDALAALRTPLLISSGPTTSRHAISLGLIIAEEAVRTSPDELVAALLRAWQRRGTKGPIQERSDSP